MQDSIRVGQLNNPLPPRVIRVHREAGTEICLATEVTIGIVIALIVFIVIAVIFMAYPAPKQLDLQEGSVCRKVHFSPTVEMIRIESLRD